MQCSHCFFFVVAVCLFFLPCGAVTERRLEACPRLGPTLFFIFFSHRPFVSLLFKLYFLLFIAVSFILTGLSRPISLLLFLSFRLAATSTPPPAPAFCLCFFRFPLSLSRPRDRSHTTARSAASDAVRLGPDVQGPAGLVLGRRP